MSYERWTINLGDATFNRLHQVDAGTFSGVSRLNEAGQWRIEMIADELDPDLIPSIKTVLVLDGTDVKYAGYVSRLGSAGGGATLFVSGTTRHLVFEGRDVWDLLSRRVVLPDPSTLNMTSSAYDTQTGVASTVATHFIEHNVGTSALADRQVAGVSVFNPSVGLNSTWAGRLQPLDAFVGEICTTGNIVCLATVDATRSPRFILRAPIDRSNAVVFSDIGDLADATQAWVPAAASWVLAAGQGEGTSRDFEAAGTATGIDRVELVSEQGNATTAAQLSAIAEAVRRDEGSTFIVEGAMSDAAARQYPAGESYLLGDTVGFNVGASRYPVPVTSITTTVTAERSIQLPVFGRWTPDRLQGLRRDVLGLADRFNSQVR